MRHVITLNAGSSSIKFALFELPDHSPRLLASGLAETAGHDRHIRVKNPAGVVTHEESWESGSGVPFHTNALQRILAWRELAFPNANVVAAGHRVVHGGVRFDAPVIITDEALDHLRKLIPLAPLHQPHNLAGIDAAREAWPHVQQVACFDTAFHRSHPFVNDVYALPRHFYDEGVRRYGFHGLSYEYIAFRLREVSPRHAAGRVVVAHLGNGASMCAISNGRSVSSSMGFTAVDGLPMGTRTGQLDPGVVMYLMQARHMTVEEISDLIYKQSGLKGLSDVSNDMRELLASDKPEAGQAIDYFVARIRRELGGLAAELNGLDAMVFCGGIGEHAWQIRERVLQDLGWIGIKPDRDANRAADGSDVAVITTPDSRVTVFVIPTDEESMIVRHTAIALDRVLEPA
jgi:acetate kinase